MTKARDLSQTPNASLGFKNRIINGDMRIDQRNNGAAVNANSSTAPYSTDRFNVNVGGSSAVIACQQVSDAPVGFVNSLRLTVSTAATPSSGQFLFLRQIIEGFNIADFGWGTATAQTVTLSFWVKASISGTYSAFAINSAEDRSYVATFTVNATNTWEYKTITIVGETTGTWLTNNSNGIRLGFDLGSGSNFNGTANAWQTGWRQRTSGTVNWVGTSGATFQVTGVQLEKGSTATSFDYRPYGTELQLAQRYYQLCNAAQASTVPSNELEVSTALGVKVDMRANPTVALVSGVAFHRPGIAFYNALAVAGTPGATGTGYQTFTIASGAGGGTAGQIIGAISLSAEL